MAATVWRMETPLAVLHSSNSWLYLWISKTCFDQLVNERSLVCNRDVAVLDQLHPEVCEVKSHVGSRFRRYS